MTKYVTSNGNVVRIHGEPDMENFKRATEFFLKKAQARRRLKDEQDKTRSAC